MTIYNMMFGLEKGAFVLMAMLYDQHVQDLPRFRDAKLIEKDEKTYIEVLTRVGKKYFNGNCNESVYLDHPLYSHFEDSLDTKFKGEKLVDDTYGRFYFTVPEKYVDDVIYSKSLKDWSKLSDELKIRIKRNYPILRKVWESIL